MASLMALHSFAMGLATVFFETAASALFVARFGAAALPWVYIAAAVVNTGTGARLLRRASSACPSAADGRRRSLFLLVARGRACALGLAFRAAAGSSSPSSSGTACSRCSPTSSTGPWRARLYDVRQAKRLFGLIGTGEVVARIAGSFSVPLLVDGLGVPNLLWLSAAALSALPGAPGRVLPLSAGATTPRLDGRAPRPRAAPRRAVRAPLMGDPYLLLVFGIAVLAVLGEVLRRLRLPGRRSRRATADATHLAALLRPLLGPHPGAVACSRGSSSRGRCSPASASASGLLVLPAHARRCARPRIVVDGPAAGTRERLVFWLVIAQPGRLQGAEAPDRQPVASRCSTSRCARRDRLGAQVAVETVVTPDHDRPGRGS